MQKPKAKILYQEQAVTPLTLGLNQRGFHSVYSEKYLYPLKFKYSILDFHGTKIDWYGDLDNFCRLADIIIKKITKDNKFSDKLLKDHRKVGGKLLKEAERIIKADLNKYNAAKLIKDINNLYQLAVELCGYGVIAVIPDLRHFKFSTLLKKIIEDKVRVKKISYTINECFSDLITPTQETIDSREKVEFLKLVSTLEKSELKNNQDLYKHYRKYLWLNFGYIGPANTFGYYLNTAKELIDQGEIKKKLAELKSETKSLVLKQQKIEQELGFNQTEKALFKAARDFMFAKQYRQELRYKMWYAADKLLGKLAKDITTDKMSLQFCTLEEIIGLAKGKIKIEDLPIVDRRRHCACVFDKKGKYKILVRNERREFVAKHVEKEEMTTDVITVHGTVAYVGVVRGRVKVVNEAGEMSKVEVGDILVTIQTVPELMPAMKKAAAFITDQGGLTCHAAIIAREMKKPCIVGTKFGTKVFKDGELVEVNANRGDVTKLDI